MDKEHSTILDRCPYIKGVPEGQDLCSESERPSGRIKVCHLENGDECEEWNEIQKEWSEEDGYTEYERAGVMPGNLDNQTDKEYNNKKEEN